MFKKSTIWVGFFLILAAAGIFLFHYRSNPEERETDMSEPDAISAPARKNPPSDSSSIDKPLQSEKETHATLQLLEDWLAFQTTDGSVLMGARAAACTAGVIAAAVRR